MTAYDAVASLESIKNSVTSHVKSFESGNADRFAGHDSLYRKGLRRSTVPEARDPSSFRGEQVSRTIISRQRTLTMRHRPSLLTA